MKQVFGLVLLGLFRSNAVLTGDNDNGNQPEDGLQRRSIVHGIEVDIANYKYALGLWIDDIYRCGASIITPSHAVTAGHCVFQILNDPSRITLHGGSTSQTIGGFTIPVVAVALHPNYDLKAFPNVSDFDAAVLTVPENEFSGKENMAPIELAISEVIAGTTCYIVGWGRTSSNGLAPTNTLRYVDLDIVSQDACDAAWSLFPITSNMFCAKYDNGADVCKGDSGGGFICNDRLSGIASFTNSFCDSIAPAGFTKIIAPSIRAFIQTQTGI